MLANTQYTILCRTHLCESFSHRDWLRSMQAEVILSIHTIEKGRYRGVFSVHSQTQQRTWVDKSWANLDVGHTHEGQKLFAFIVVLFGDLDQSFAEFVDVFLLAWLWTEHIFYKMICPDNIQTFGRENYAIRKWHLPINVAAHNLEVNNVITMMFTCFLSFCQQLLSLCPPLASLLQLDRTDSEEDVKPPENRLKYVS